MNGRLTDVLIKDIKAIDPSTGIEYFVNSVDVYADAGMQKTIEAVEGVSSVTSVAGFYLVNIDPRYDREYVKAEIEAAIKISTPSGGTNGNL